MARDFDGIDDQIDFGSDASIDDYVQKTILMHADPRLVDIANDDLAGKGSTQTDFSRSATSNGHLRLVASFSLVNGEWKTPDNSAATGPPRAFGFTWDRASADNNPSMFIDATSQAITEVVMPVGDPQGDAAQNLVIGVGDSRYDGTISHFLFDSTLFTAASVNRHRWWGVAPGGPSTVDVWHPFWSDSLTNKGTATANGTATGTTMASLPKVERMWGSCLGVGR